MVDAIVKMLLVLLGALVGCVLTRYLAKRRLRRLVPLAIAQLKSGVLQCQMAFTMDEAKFAGLVLDSAYRFASEVISSEFEEAQWREAAQLIQEIQPFFHDILVSTALFSFSWSPLK